MIANTIEIDIEWGDCDPARIVFYPNYFAWFDKGTRHLFEAAGLSIKTLFDDYGVIGTPLVDAQAEFISPSRFGDCITVTSTIQEWRTKTLIVAHVIYNGAELAVRGREIRAWVAEHPEQPKKLRAIPIPEAIKQRFD